MDEASSFGHANVSVQDDSELPSYDEIAPDANSRFGRWKGWIEKRAAERYADDTPEKRLARQLKGWGPQADFEAHEDPDPMRTPLSPLTTSLHRTRTILSDSPHLPTPSVLTHEIKCEALPPSHAIMCTFGSRFIPHSEHPILSVLPMVNDKRLLIGHSCGLCVLDMESEVSDLNTKEPRRYDIFTGEGIHQMDILELEETNTTSSPKGIVLALVGTELKGENERNNKECNKTIRMYNFAGLANLAQWACDTKGKEPLDLARSPSSVSTSPDTRNRKSKLRASSVDFSGLSISHRSSSFIPSTSRMHNRNSVIPEKDIDDAMNLPMGWATEYVSIVTPGTRLENHNILFYALQRGKGRSRVVARLAVATKQSVLLYETLRGERSFRFVKEFYLPACPKSITFVQQRPVQKNDFSPDTDTARGLTASVLSWLRLSQINSYNNLHGQLSLLVTFDKKACLIRILDSAVTELDMWEANPHSRRASSMSLIAGAQNPFRISRSSFEGPTLKESKTTWLPPAEISLPSSEKAMSGTDMLTVYLLTREQHTHIVPAPILVPLNMFPPLKIIKWNIRPADIVARLCYRSITGEPFLQVTALGQEGVEIQELPLSFLDPSNTKGKQPETSVIVQVDVGPGGAGFLRVGGYWNKTNMEKPLPPLPLHRNLTRSTVDTLELNEKIIREQGFYAWARKGYSDWRIFWLGGDASDGPPPAPSTP